MEWNANEPLQRQQEVQVFLDIEKVDIWLISETYFIRQSLIKYIEYKVSCFVHIDNAAKWDSAIIIREKVIHHQETTAIKIKTKTYEVIVSAVYCPSEQFWI